MLLLCGSFSSLISPNRAYDQRSIQRNVTTYQGVVVKPSRIPLSIRYPASKLRLQDYENNCIVKILKVKLHAPSLPNLQSDFPQTNQSWNRSRQFSFRYFFPLFESLISFSCLAICENPSSSLWCLLIDSSLAIQVHEERSVMTMNRPIRSIFFGSFSRCIKISRKKVF